MFTNVCLKPTVGGEGVIILRLSRGTLYQIEVPSRIIVPVGKKSTILDNQMFYRGRYVKVKTFSV